LKKKNEAFHLIRRIPIGAVKGEVLRPNPEGLSDRTHTPIRGVAPPSGGETAFAAYTE